MDRNLIRAAFYIRCGSRNRLFLRFTPFTVTKAYCNEIALRTMAEYRTTTSYSSVVYTWLLYFSSPQPDSDAQIVL